MRDELPAKLATHLKKIWENLFWTLGNEMSRSVETVALDQVPFLRKNLV